MNIFTTLIGTAATIFGASTIILRHTHPNWFRKLGPMKEKWGGKAGYIVHFIGYSLIPLIFGCVTIINGLNGGSFFDH
jgi:hypothetical protein